MKIATIVAPFLLIGGYIAADYYQSTREEEYFSSEARKIEAHQLLLDVPCKIPVAACTLKKDDLVLTLKADSKHYYLTASKKLDGVTIGMAQNDRETGAIHMQRLQGEMDWISEIRTLTNLKTASPLLMRLAVVSNNKRYFAEFPISTTGPWGVE